MASAYLPTKVPFYPMKLLYIIHPARRENPPHNSNLLLNPLAHRKQRMQGSFDVLPANWAVLNVSFLYY
jgi:hypothetical protein